VGFLPNLPGHGASVDVASYTHCADMTGHEVDSSLVLRITCENNTKARYVIVQSLDSSRERLCIGEVAVYKKGRYCCSNHAICNALLTQESCGL